MDEFAQPGEWWGARWDTARAADGDRADRVVTDAVTWLRGRPWGGWKNERSRLAGEGGAAWVASGFAARAG